MAGWGMIYVTLNGTDPEREKNPNQNKTSSQFVADEI